MSGADVIALRLELALAVVLLTLGAVMALGSAHGLKRVGGVVIAFAGAIAACAPLRVDAAVIAGGAAALASLMLGVALMVRAHESYGASEMAALDAADEAAETPERRT